MMPYWTLAALFLLSANASGADSEYRLRYDVLLQPAERQAEVVLTLDQDRDLARHFCFRIDPRRYADFDGDGAIVFEDDHVGWTPPKEGGRLTWTVVLTHKRNSSGYDGYVAEDWAVFRGDDLIPAATVRTLKGAESNAQLYFRLPDDWSVVTPYRREADGSFHVDHPDRRFDRPTGWIAAGKLGVRRDRIAGVAVAIAAPVDSGFRRQDTLAFLHWTLPELKKVFPDFDTRLLVVGSGDPMWRGGLSGPASLYLHADRPLISENGTSTLLHELVHTALGMRPAGGNDWIVEGFAEYYALEILKRSGTISVQRYTDAIEQLADWGADVDDLFVQRSHGPVTARAVGVLTELDRELIERTDGRYGLDDLVRELAGNQDISYTGLRSAATRLAGGSVNALAPKRVPGA